jgi:hypothetical protein
LAALNIISGGMNIMVDLDRIVGAGLANVKSVKKKICEWSSPGFGTCVVRALQIPSIYWLEFDGVSSNLTSS